MTKVFIDGSAGTAGLRIHSRLENRADLELITLTGEATSRIQPGPGCRFRSAA